MLRTVGQTARLAVKKSVSDWSLNFGQSVSFDKFLRHFVVFNGGRGVVFRLNFGPCVNLLPLGIPVIFFLLLVQQCLLKPFVKMAWCLFR